MTDLGEAAEQRGTLEDLMRVLQRRGWVVLCTVGFTLAVIAVLILTSKPVYESRAKLLVNRGQAVSAFSPNVRTLSWEEELGSEIETILSARIYLRAQDLIAGQGLTGRDGEPYEISPTSMNATTPGRSSIIQIYYRDPNPLVAQRVVAALTQAYTEFRSEERKIDPSGFLQQEIDQLSEEIADWEQRRADFLVREGATAIDEERSSLLITRRSIESQLATIRSEVAERKARLDYMRNLVAGFDHQDISAEVYLFGEAEERIEPGLATLRRKILDTKTEYYDARSRFTDTHPTVLTLADRLREMNEELRREAEGYVGHLGALYQASVAREASLDASLAFVNEQLSAFPDREAQLAVLDRSIGTLRASHDALTRRRIDALTTRVGSAFWDIVILQEASEGRAVRTRDYIRLGLVPLFSLLLGLGLAFLLDNLDRSVKDRAEAEMHLKVPVLATVDRFRT